MKPSEIVKALKLLTQEKIPAFLWGSPGVGKSQVVSQTAQALGWDLRDIRALLLDPVDLRGLPRFENGNTVWSPPGFLPHEGEGIFFLDELNAAPPMVMNACLQLVLDRQVGEYHLPDGWAIIAAGNLESDRANVSRMPTPLRNRFVHIDFTPDLEDWCAWAGREGIHPAVVAFLRFKTALLFSFDKDSNAFPTPRSWARVSQIIQASENGGSLIGSLPPAIVEALVEGTVGKGAAAEFAGYWRVFDDLPNIEQILQEPERARVPKQPAVLYALATTLSRRISPENLGNAVIYLKRMPPEMQVLTMKECTEARPDLMAAREFVEWASKLRMPMGGGRKQ